MNRVTQSVSRRAAVVRVGVLRLCVFSLASGVMMAPRSVRAQQQVAGVQDRSAESAAYRASLLDRLVTADFTNATISRALEVLATRSGVQIVYQRGVVDASEHTVSLHAVNITLGRALDHVLQGTDLQVVAVPNAGLVVKANGVGHAQDSSTVLGTVIDGRTKLPLRGVTVTLDKSTRGVVTDGQGRFRLANVAVGPHRVVVRWLGYKQRTVDVVVSDGGIVVPPIVLEPSGSVQLAEVVTTGAGDEMKLEVGNSIGTINADSVVRTTPIRNISDLLDGRVSGLNVSHTSGTVGAGAKIRIRGESSLLTSEDPVVIVDGVRYNAAFTTPVSGSTVSGGGPTNPPSINAAAPKVPASSRLDDIDPESIESIDILKGPAASAMYGSDAANGVIIIKTKRGKAGPTHWGLSGEYGLSTVDAHYSDNYFGWGELLGGVAAPNSCTFVQRAARQCTLDSLTFFNPLNHGDTSPFGSGNTQHLNGQVSGGSDHMQYFVGATYDDEMGMLRIPPALEAATVKLLNGTAIPSYAAHPNILNSGSLSTNLTGQFSHGDAALSLNGLRQYHRDTPAGNAGFVTEGMQSPGYIDTLSHGWGSTTPAADFLTKNDEETSHGYGSLSGNWRFLPQVLLHATGGLDWSMNDAQSLLPQQYVLPVAIGSTSNRTHTQTTNYVQTADGNGTWTFPVNTWLRLVTTAGAQYSATTSSSVTASGVNLPTGSNTVNGATTSSVSEYQGESATAGWYLQAVASLNDRLFVTAAVRNDASSSFGSDAKQVAYPKWNASWLISQEPFFPSIPSVSSLRLRAGFGHAGSQPPFDARFKTYQYIPGFVDGTVSNTIGINTVGNPDLLPEKSFEAEGGFDLSLGNDRVIIGMTVEHKTTDNALVNRTLPMSLGSNLTQMQNIGKIANGSFEIDATIHPIDLPTVNWSTSFFFTHQWNRLLSLGNVTQSAATQDPFNPQQHYAVGYPIDGDWARPLLGYYDINNDGIIEPNELKVGDSLVFAGRTSPDRTLGWQNSVALWSGRVTLGGNFTYENGATQVNTGLFYQCNSNLCRYVVDSTLPLSQQALGAASSRTVWPYLQQVSVLRLTEVSLSITLPASMVRALRATSGSVAIQGRNLALWSNYRGADPDVNSNPTGDAVVDYGTVAEPHQWFFRVNLGY